MGKYIIHGWLWVPLGEDLCLVSDSVDVNTSPAGNLRFSPLAGGTTEQINQWVEGECNVRTLHFWLFPCLYNFFLGVYIGDRHVQNAEWGVGTQTLTWRNICCHDIVGWESTSLKPRFLPLKLDDWSDDSFPFGARHVFRCFCY